MDGFHITVGFPFALTPVRVQCYAARGDDVAEGFAMKKIVLAALAVWMLSGCELAALYCDDDFKCGDDRLLAPTPH